MHNHDKFPHHSHIASRKPEFLVQGRARAEKNKHHQQATVEILVDTLTPSRGHPRSPLISTASNEYMQVVVVVVLLYIFPVCGH